MLKANTRNIRKWQSYLLDNTETDVQDFIKALLVARSGNNPPNQEMMKIDRLLETHGVEFAQSISGENCFMYCNAGDAYATTIIWYRNDFYIGCWADIVEANMNDFE